MYSSQVWSYFVHLQWILLHIGGKQFLYCGKPHTSLVREKTDTDNLPFHTHCTFECMGIYTYVKSDLIFSRIIYNNYVCILPSEREREWGKRAVSADMCSVWLRADTSHHLVLRAATLPSLSPPNLHTLKFKQIIVTFSKYFLHTLMSFQNGVKYCMICKVMT